MDFGIANRDEGSSTAKFLEMVGEFVAEEHEELEQLWEAACVEAWPVALREFSAQKPVTCPHTSGTVRGDSEARSHSHISTSSLAASIETRGCAQSSQPGPDSAIFAHSVSTMQSSDGASEAQSIATINHGHARQESGGDNGSESKSESENGPCRECAGSDPSSFPYVSDVAPLAILMILEAVRSHKELHLLPMQPAETPARPQYLGGGNSFKVVRVPWQQVRVDTQGRVLTDAVYKRLNHPDGSRGAWLEFMKDVVVTHHMTYHVSAAHKRNIVRLLGLGFEPTVTQGVFGDEKNVPTPVIALEHAPYGTLADLYYSSAFLTSYQRKLCLMSDVADGLQALHCSSIIHGDIKPENILIFGDADRGIMAKLGDFGLAVIDPEAGPEYQRLPGGTTGYTAPEVFAGPMPRKNLQYTDVYSFGIVFWQTLLGGTMPFSLLRHPSTLLPLSEKDIIRVITGMHQDLANTYNVSVNRASFLWLNQEQEHEIATDRQSSLPDDTVNALLLAIAQSTLEPRMQGATGDEDSATIPDAELPILLSVLQIALSSRPSDRRLQPIQLLLGRRYERREIEVSVVKWDAKVSQALATKADFAMATGRILELFVSVYENFFTVLQRKPHCSYREQLVKLDVVLARHLSRLLLEHYLSKFLSGDQSNSVRRSILQYLFLTSTAGSSVSAAGGLAIHQLLGAVMERPVLYALGSAHSVLRENSTLAWYEQQPLPQCLQFREKLRKGRIVSSQSKLNQEQMRVFVTVQLSQNVGPINLNAQNEDGDTLLHVAMRSGNTPLAYSLFHDHGADVRIRNGVGEEPIIWLHRLHYVKTMAQALVEAGADIETSATVRLDVDESFLVPVVERTMTASALFSTPLLRAIQARNVEAVIALVSCGAKVGCCPATPYRSFATSPVAIAAAMMEHECLEILLPAWEPNGSPDPDATEILALWECAIAGLSRIDLVQFHGEQYGPRVRATLEVMTEYLGPCYLVKNKHSSMEFTVEGGDMAWVEAILDTLHSSPLRACLADLQLGLRAAVSRGHREIAQKIMSFGALPLLPWQWAVSGFVIGRPGVWSSSLVSRLQREMFEAGHSMYDSECCLHFCATAGEDGINLATDILAHPVLNPCLKPDLSQPANATVDLYTPADDSLWTLPRLDRPDEDGKTPLYYALADGEFPLARLFVRHGASCQERDWAGHGSAWSLPAQIFEDGRAHFTLQLEFLLKTYRESFPFVIHRRVFDRLYPQSQPLVDRVPKKVRWPIEKGNILTAMAGFCPWLDKDERSMLWNAVLPLFPDASHLLAKSQPIDGHGQDALQIAISHADCVSSRNLIEAMKEAGIFASGEYSVIDQTRDMLLAEPPARIVDSPIKRRFISFRLDLSEIVRLLLEAGDKGTLRSPPEDVADRILEVLGNELGILVIGFRQRGVIVRDEFKQSTENLCNAMMRTVYDCLDEAFWSRELEKLEMGLTELLSDHFICEIKSWTNNGFRGARIKLHFTNADTGMPFPVFYSRSPSGKKPAVVPLLDGNLYRKIRWMEKTIERSPEGPFTALTEMEIAALSSLGIERAVPSVDFLTSRVLELCYPSRPLVEQTPLTNRPTPRYLSQRPSTLPEAVVDFQSQNSKNKLVKALQQIDPSTKSLAADVVMRRLSGFVDDLTDLGVEPNMDPTLRHPLFGRVRTETGYMDLPVNAYIEGARRMAQRLLAEYRRAGMELPDELKQLGLEDLEDESDAESDSQDEDHDETGHGADTTSV